MKSCFLICIMSFVFVLNANAQKEYGVKGGLNYSNNITFIDSDIDIPYDYKLDFHIGLFTIKEMNEKWNFKPEILYSRKGYQNSSDFKVNLDYLNASIIYEYQIIDDLYVEMGPEIGFLLEEQGLYDNRIDVGLSGGLNYYLNDKISLNVRFTQGLLSTVKDNKFRIIEEDFSETTTNVFFLNRNFQLSLNYIYR